jgi:hypothetical protein
MKTVYGLMTDGGSGNEFLYDLGVWESEDEADRYLKDELSHLSGIWIEAITVNDAVPLSLEADGDEMETCDLCQVEYNEADIIVIDDVKVCINCEPAFRNNRQGQ